MALAVTVVLAIFWLAVAYRQFQRGDLLLAGVFLLVGIVLTIFRLRLRRLARKAVSAPQVIFPPETSLLSVPRLVPSGFEYGVEILNDDRTPMEFVVSALCGHLSLNRTEALKTMLKVHTRGGVLLKVSTAAEAHRIAQAVSNDSAGHNYPLVCRAVSVTK